MLLERLTLCKYGAMFFATAQDAYGALVKDHLSPALRELGFRGSGGSYGLPEAEHWALLSFQRSVCSDRDEARFTINVLVTSKAAWSHLRDQREYFPIKPLASTFYGTSIWQRRIGAPIEPNGHRAGIAARI